MTQSEAPLLKAKPIRAVGGAVALLGATFLVSWRLTGSLNGALWLTGTLAAVGVVGAIVSMD